MSHAELSRSAVLTVSGLAAAGWLLVGCGNGNDESPDGGTSPAEVTTTETATSETTTTEATTTEPTSPETTTDGENTIEIPSPNIDIPSPEIPEVTPSPVP
ncbi:hypothetical protein [Mycobacterium sp. ZZG]